MLRATRCCQVFRTRQASSATKRVVRVRLVRKALGADSHHWLLPGDKMSSCMDEARNLRSKIPSELLLNPKHEAPADHLIECVGPVL